MIKIQNLSDFLNHIIGSKIMWIQIVGSLKNLCCDKTWTLKLWQNLKTQIVTTLKNSNGGKIQRLKLWKKTLKNLSFDQTEN